MHRIERVAEELKQLPMVEDATVAKLKRKKRNGEPDTEYRLWTTLHIGGRYYSLMAVSSSERRQVFDDALPAAIRQQVSEVVARIRSAI